MRGEQGEGDAFQAERGAGGVCGLAADSNRERRPEVVLVVVGAGHGLDRTVTDRCRQFPLELLFALGGTHQPAGATKERIRGRHD
ncbi:hypothetical protein OIE14_00815 [Micromonospora peucetia]|uniref:Uncharacterized protein n=1 Tax=Micromonospora peucetia TaxID=47871 RepID=A0ABZ1EGE1_9ACTN|nr:hypothetical protein [Micromonospora peucetia]WSA32666.1 hypothetical protein OIE14_00815 [Micromonospora peucetia]